MTVCDVCGKPGHYSLPFDADLCDEHYKDLERRQTLLAYNSAVEYEEFWSQAITEKGKKKYQEYSHKVGLHAKTGGPTPSGDGVQHDEPGEDDRTDGAPDSA